LTSSDQNIITFIDDIVSRHGTSVESVIPILQEIQQEFHYLPEEALKRVCEITEITPARITGISTFYTQFRHQPAGKHTIRICAGTACHVKGSGHVYDAFRRELKLEDHEDTDKDGNFTIEKVSCLGCCTLAPVVKIDEVTYGHVSPEKTGEILRDFLVKNNNVKSGSQEVRTRKLHEQGEIRIGLGSCCIASGSSDVKFELERTLAEANISVNIKQVGCVGICNQVPVLEVVKPGEATAFYAKIRPEDVREVVLNHFRPEGFINRVKTRMSGLFDNMIEKRIPYDIKRYDPEQRDTPVSLFMTPQVSVATENRGVIKPCDIDEYQREGGFEALKKCLKEKTSQEVIDEIKRSGLRGRGGAGFPTGIKWQHVKDQTGSEKYIICNGDEGDPGAFMDRMLLESYPFRIIEGMLIAGYATGASEGIFYIRTEYPLAVNRISEAIRICREKGIIGKHIMGSDLTFEIRIFEGAGAFVCGEETALISSIEGKRGTPRIRPPYPAIEGLNGKPTLVNNVETYSLISWIIRNGADRFAGIGTSGSKGTKVFALAGKVNRGGLIEVPMGITIRQIVEEIGGGIANGKSFKAVQIGGPSGGCLPASRADMPIDFEALHEAGSMMGSGGLIVMDETDCMVDIAHYFLSFTQNQSCGKCTFCRIGTRRMLELLDKIRSGKGKEEDLIILEQLAGSTKKGSLCGLGRTAPNPVLSTLHYFRHEYEAHLQGRCPAGKCSSLIKYIVTEECIGCTICAQKCPSDAIAFKPYEVHHIDLDKCIKCDICRQACPAGSIVVQ
jgi:NADH:ubiquinone oxidoreductase subunit F (NADH-binding)/NADH:ubiquinone oxidoreductase subunit E/Pyruvate/2-oxoacid:ferredoxin oxidoreductase delta subunit